MHQANDTKTTLINIAVIAIGSYHLPLSVASGALIGASLFIARKQNYPVFHKAWLFMISFFSGVFGCENTEEIMNYILPSQLPLHINSFIGALLAAAFAVVLIEKIYAWLDTRLTPTTKERDHDQSTK